MERWVKTFHKWKKLKKTTNQTYGNITSNKNEVLPYSATHVDLLGPWEVLFKAFDLTNIRKTISKLPVVDSSTSWTEIIYIEDKTSVQSTTHVDQVVLWTVLSNNYDGTNTKKHITTESSGLSHFLDWDYLHWRQN